MFEMRRKMFPLHSLKLSRWGDSALISMLKDKHFFADINANN